MMKPNINLSHLIIYTIFQNVNITFYAENLTFSKPQTIEYLIYHTEIVES